MGEDGQLMQEAVELWLRDPIECIRELIGNPAFRDYLAYAPERVYTNQDATIRRYDEMWTADWWWNLQVCYYITVHAIHFGDAELGRAA